MTPEQITMARELAKCRFGFQRTTERFAKDMARQANTDPGKELTPPQALFLAKSVWRFRLQINDATVLKLARAALPQGEES